MATKPRDLWEIFVLILHKSSPWVYGICDHFLDMVWGLVVIVFVNFSFTFLSILSTTCHTVCAQQPDNAWSNLDAEHGIGAPVELAPAFHAPHPNLATGCPVFGHTSCPDLKLRAELFLHVMASVAKTWTIGRQAVSKK